MSTKAALLCIILSICAYCGMSLTAAPAEGYHSLSSITIPVFMWSDKQSATKTNTEIMDTLTPESIEHTLHSLINLNNNKEDSRLSKALGNLQKSPEVIVLFAEPELRTDQVPQFGSAFSTETDGGSFRGLNQLLSQSKWSVIAPYASVGGQFSLLESTITRISDSFSSIIVVQESGSTLFELLGKLSGVETINLSEIEEFLTTKTDMFNDGVTDLIVVSLNGASGRQIGSTLASHDDIVSRVSAIVSAATSGDYVAIYSGDTPSPSEIQWSFPHQSVETLVSVPSENFARSRRSATEQSVVPVYLRQDPNTAGMGPMDTINPDNVTHNYFSGVVLEVYIIVAILLAMLFTGGCAIFSLQTPDRWEAPRARRVDQ